MRYLAIASLLLTGCHFYQEVGDDADAAAPGPPDATSADATPPSPSACGDCPAPDPGNVSVCGWLRDAETDDLIGTVSTSWQECDSLDPRPATGPCAVELSFHDALMFAGNPTGTPSLEPSRLTVNTCGRFIAENIPAPALGFMAAAADDHPAIAQDQYSLSSVFFPTSLGVRIGDLTLYVVRRSTDAMWTAAAGSPFGAGTSFGERGAYLPIFRHRGQPVAGVVVTENGETQPADDYYFSDADPSARTTLTPGQSSTGPNGSALMVDSALVNHSGQGSEDQLDGCVWPSDLADAIPGVYFVQRRDSENALNGNFCQ